MTWRPKSQGVGLGVLDVQMSAGVLHVQHHKPDMQQRDVAAR
jgi:hypothetical protein